MEVCDALLLPKSLTHLEQIFLHVKCAVMVASKVLEKLCCAFVTFYSAVLVLVRQFSVTSNHYNIKPMCEIVPNIYTIYIIER